MKVGFSIAGVILGLFLLGWVIQGNDFFMFQFFAPKYEQVRRETFEQSKSYQHGTIQELHKMQYEYAQADSSAKVTLASIILHRADEYTGELPSDLEAFIKELRNKKLKPKY